MAGSDETGQEREEDLMMNGRQKETGRIPQEQAVRQYLLFKPAS